MNDKTTRRELLAAAPAVGVLTASLLSASGAATAATPAKSGGKTDLNDPQERFKAQVKMRGSLADGPVHTFVRLHIWGYANDGNLVPFFSMNNYSVNVWRRLENGNYAVRVYEVGVYTKFDSYDVITEWQNPFTDELRKVHQFRSGPLNVEFGVDGIKAGAETTVKPRPMQVELMEDSVIATTQSNFRFPSPFQPDKYPKESPGRLFHWDSFYSHVSPLAAVLDPDQPSVPTTISLTNFVSWAPWLAMAQKPGRTYGRGMGRKISGLNALPVEVVRSIEQYTPQIVDIGKWGPPYDDIADYKQIIDAAATKP